MDGACGVGAAGEDAAAVAGVDGALGGWGGGGGCIGVRAGERCGVAGDGLDPPLARANNSVIWDFTASRSVNAFCDMNWNV